MSRSPGEGAGKGSAGVGAARAPGGDGATGLQAYRDAWSALSQLIGEGRSFSGRERNCAFLNTRDGRFADVSAAAGLDLKDDGRAVAVADWDSDGRLDLWVTNRTAPRVRLLINRSGGLEANGFVAFRLRGVRANRDAVGARVTVTTADGTRRVRELRAGDGFLAQSSQWIHFGLGGAGGPAEVAVRWPGGGEERFGAVAAGGRYLLVEGEGKPEPWKAPEGVALPDADGVAAETAEAPTLSSTRTWLIGRVPAPELTYTGWEGRERRAESRPGRPLVINLFSATCVPCAAELREWVAALEEIRGAGLEVLVLSTDGLPGGRGGTADRRRLTAGAFPFRSGRITPATAEALEIFHRTFVEWQQPLPLPSTFLLDGRGDVAAIYKGLTAAEVIVRDAGLLDQTVEAQRAAAVPFAGRWASLPFPANPARVAAAFIGAGKEDAALAYLEGCRRRTLEPNALAGVQAMLGDLLLRRGESAAAAEAWGGLHASAPGDGERHSAAGEALLKNNLAAPARLHLARALESAGAGAGEPGSAGVDADLLFNLALAEMATGRAHEAAAHLVIAARRAPGDAVIHFHLGNARMATGDRRGAAEAYRESLRLRPGWPFPANNLAWILATAPEEELRDGAEAVRLALVASRGRGDRDPSTLSTLAAAYAEAGQFGRAVETCDRAIAAAGVDRRLARLREQLKRARAGYAQRNPWRDRPLGEGGEK